MIWYAVLVLSLAYFIGYILYSYKRYVWNRKQVKCMHCKQNVYIAYTWFNILEDRNHWICYYCKEKNYADEGADI